MSGGSYNYLYCHVRGLEEQRGDLESMVDRLAGLGYATEAAAASRHVLDLLDQAEAAAQKLEDVWRAVEWWDSGDSSEESVREVAAKYRGEDSP
ncbi:hypothetical protein [Pseudonocardia sp.]|jgi:hypothetical protein|uniref:hypothetical protein n=1 Tax=Pseudonocardia sp. TaxID=60912 RepID=UPI002618D8D9|nr:hypothetical protein [Pseudonocardia sp.]MCW2720703.1 hypothetical protein [Pseudonocardia sp.]